MDEEQNESNDKKERRAQKREDRDRELTKAARIRTVLHMLPWMVLVLVLTLVGFGSWKFYRAINLVSDSLGQDLSREFADQGQEHMKEGERAGEPYNSNPPTSGPHWPDPLKDGIYNTEKPDEGAIHALEHGRIWISYKSSIPQSTKEAIERLAGSQVRMVVTVRNANETDIAVAAWRHLDGLNVNPDGSFDEQRVLDFIKRYRDTAPEKGVPAMMGKTY